MLELLRITRFGLVGLTATLIHAGTYTLFVLLTPLSPTLANLAAYPIALGASLFGHSRITFGVALDSSRIAKFMITSLTALGVNALFVLLIDALNRPPEYAALLFLVTPVLTYILFRNWVYQD